MKKKAVLFTSNNARTFDFEDWKDLPDFKNLMIHPDLGRVEGVAPHYWKFVNGMIMPLNEEEKIERDNHIETNGIDHTGLSMPLIGKEKDSILYLKDMSAAFSELKAYFKLQGKRFNLIYSIHCLFLIAIFCHLLGWI